jgi:hypothetical protein
MRIKGSLHNLMASAAGVRLSRLLMGAAALHLLLALALNWIGRLGLFPNTFDESGIGISFAVDSLEYRKYIIVLVKLLERDGLLAWIKDNTPFHVKLYSLCYAVLGQWLGYTTLSAEPLNLTYYLLILVFVFLLGREVFDRRVGLLAAGLVAAWPSLLLHTTQLLRDPLFIAALLALLFVCAVYLKRECAWIKALALAFAGGALASIIWLIRSQMWEVMIACVALCLGLMLLKAAWERRIRVSNFAGCCLLLLIVLCLPQLGRRLNLYSYPADPVMVRVQGAGATAPQVVSEVRTLPPGSSLPARISFLRSSFINSYPSAGSNIDREVGFKSFYDIVLYLPRAAEIGCCSPFPNMWFEEGPQVGHAGRLLSGIETLLFYLLEILTVVCLWRHRRNLTAWLLFVTAGIGMLALGLVVANIATLYRMRYGFWMLIVILGIKGAITAFSDSRDPGARREITVS